MTNTDRTQQVPGIAREHEQDLPTHIVVYHGQPDGSTIRRERSIRSLAAEGSRTHRRKDGTTVRLPRLVCTWPEDILNADVSQATVAAPDEYRLEARVVVKQGETAGRIGGGHLQLIRLVLTDGGSHEREDGTIANPPDVVCTLRPDDARRLIQRLHDAIEQADRQSA